MLNAVGSMDERGSQILLIGNRFPGRIISLHGVLSSANDPQVTSRLRAPDRQRGPDAVLLHTTRRIR